MCPQCSALVLFDVTLAFDHDLSIQCGQCGSSSKRSNLVLTSLENLNQVNWALFSSDMYLYGEETFSVPAPGQTAWSAGVNLTQIHQAAKWQAQFVFVQGAAANRYHGNLIVLGETAYVSVGDNEPDSPKPTEYTNIHVQWYRTGVQTVESVPAWRQALFAASQLVSTLPAAAIVLVAAGFESFFNDWMLIQWVEKELDRDAFERMSNRVQSITNRMDWLPAAVSRDGLSGELRKSWGELVNSRRNRVAHGGNVNFSTAEATESLKIALEAILFFDPNALTRPHTYFANR